jgi:hypothetical protein
LPALLSLFRVDEERGSGAGIKARVASGRKV